MIYLFVPFDGLSCPTRLFHLIRVKYEQLEEAGYPYIVLEEHPDPYLCIFGSYADQDGGRREAGSDETGSGRNGGSIM